LQAEVRRTSKRTALNCFDMVYFPVVMFVVFSEFCMEFYRSQDEGNLFLIGGELTFFLLNACLIKNVPSGVQTITLFIPC
jgi:hypothetical protein